MSLARAFTKRNKRPDLGSDPPNRAASTRRNGQHILRHQISSPVQLISTTNMLSFNAPDIFGSSSASSLTSADDSDSSRISPATPDTSPENSSVESSPVSVEPNHLSCYFQPPARSNSTAGSHRQSNSSTEDAPAIPQRAMSHTKATHKALARRRSQSKKSPPNSVHNPQTRSSAEIVKSELEPAHPFGRELEQVNELAEEFGMRDSVVDEDARVLQQKGLRRFGAQEYRMEIEGLFGGVFEDEILTAAWI